MWSTGGRGPSWSRCSSRRPGRHRSTRRRSAPTGVAGDRPGRVHRFVHRPVRVLRVRDPERPHRLPRRRPGRHGGVPAVHERAPPGARHAAGGPRPSGSTTTVTSLRPSGGGSPSAGTTRWPGAASDSTCSPSRRPGHRRPGTGPLSQSEPRTTGPSITDPPGRGMTASWACRSWWSATPTPEDEAPTRATTGNAPCPNGEPGPRALVPLLSAYRPQRILSSPYVRCCGTVRPWPRPSGSAGRVRRRAGRGPRRRGHPAAGHHGGRVGRAVHPRGRGHRRARRRWSRTDAPRIAAFGSRRVRCGSSSRPGRPWPSWTISDGLPGPAQGPPERWLTTTLMRP